MLMAPRSYNGDSSGSRGPVLLLAFTIFAVALLPVALATPSHAADLTTQRSVSDRYFLPDAKQSRTVTAAPSPKASESMNAEGMIVMTERVAVKETGPAETIKKFGEVYAFAPSFIAVHRDEPLRLVFWNLQPDDEHDIMLLDPGGQVMMHQRLLPLSKNAWVFTFHKEGIFDFRCAAHQPEMTGQILVLPPLPRR
jgi:plastocyanin